MNLSFFKGLYAHMEWADALIWSAVLAEPAASQDDFIVESLVHLHMVQRAYMDLWKGETGLPATRGDFGDLPEIRDWARSFHPEAAAFIGGLSEERLGEVVANPWAAYIEKEIGAPPGPARLGDTMYQVAAHSVHHRAQVNRRIREVGGAPNLVDYIGWIWKGRPQAEW